MTRSADPHQSAQVAAFQSLTVKRPLRKIQRFLVLAKILANGV
jgi:hypothetical protein